ncbi:MAG: Nif3-like dinuclear metal center hexameric protein [bacterium]
MGLFVNIGFWEILLKYNVDVILVGEIDEYAIRYTLDCGVAVVETTHPSSENPGLKKFSEELARDFPDTKVYFYDVKTNGIIYKALKSFTYNSNNIIAVLALR